MLVVVMGSSDMILILQGFIRSKIRVPWELIFNVRHHISGETDN
jgi:hypothetical protein